MPARNSVTTSCTRAGVSAKARVRIGKAGTTMCSALKASAVTEASSTSDGFFPILLRVKRSNRGPFGIMPARDCFVAPLPAMAAGGIQSCGGRPEAREAFPLPPLGVEIRRVEPAREGGAQRRPVAVDHREPRRIAIAPAGDRRLSEQPFVLEPQTQRRRP